MADCVSCGKPLDAYAGFCRHCGAAMPVPEGGMPAAAVTEEPTLPGVDEAQEATQVLPKDPSADEEPTTATLPTAPDARAWTCAACDTAAGADDLFCGRCGAPRPQTDPGACASCGAPLQTDMDFCPRCGARRGHSESAASRTATTVLPAAAYVAHAATAPAARAGADSRRTAPAAPPPPPPPIPQRSAGKGRGGRVAVILVAVMVLAGIGAGVYFGFFHDKGGPQDATTPIEPIMTSLSAKQKQLDDALQALQATGQGFAEAAAVAQELSAAVAAAEADSDAIRVDDPQARDILAAFRGALDAHAAYAATLAALPDDPADMTVAQAGVALAQAASAQAAYDKLGDLAPMLPPMPFPAAAIDRLVALIDEMAQQVGQLVVLESFLQEIETLFPDSQAERLAAEDIAAQLEATEIPPDNAAGQMAAQAVRLRGVVGRIDSIVPPDDQRAQQIQATYREAVLHWVTAARQYAKWMRHLWDYYQVSGDWPPVNGIEADTYLDPAYDAARQAIDLAAAARERLAGEIDALAAEVGGTTGFTADDM